MHWARLRLWLTFNYATAEMYGLRFRAEVRLRRGLRSFGIAKSLSSVRGPIMKINAAPFWRI